MRKIFFLLLCIISYCLPTKAQDLWVQNYNTFSDIETNNFAVNFNTGKDKEKAVDLSGWVLGGQTGFYFAGKATANYYKGEGENNIATLLYYDWIKQKIKEQVEGYDYSNIVLPENMSYQPAFYLGFFAKLSNKNGSGSFIEFNFAKLMASDVFTIEVQKFNGGLKQPYVKECNIAGIEERINVNLGYSFAFTKSNLYKPYLEFGFNINDTKVKDHKIVIGSFEASIMNPQNVYYNIPQGGIGYGGFIGGGVQIFVSNVSLDPGINVFYKKINLGENPVFDLHTLLYVRLAFRL